MVWGFTSFGLGFEVSFPLGLFRASFMAWLLSGVFGLGFRLDFFRVISSDASALRIVHREIQSQPSPFRPTVSLPAGL